MIFNILNLTKFLTKIVFLDLDKFLFKIPLFSTYLSAIFINMSKLSNK